MVIYSRLCAWIIACFQVECQRCVFSTREQPRLVFSFLTSQLLFFIFLLVWHTFNSCNQDLFIYFLGAQPEVNVALGKNAYQSTSGSVGGLAALAVDGITDADYYRGSCTHTARSISPWWMVDLGRHCSISHLRVYNRDRLGNFYYHTLVG